MAPLRDSSRLPSAVLRSTSQTSLSERRLLLDCLDELPEGAEIVELGTAQGGTTRILAAYAAQRGMHVTTVDLRDDPMLRESLIALGVNAVCASSHEPSQYWPTARKVDLILIDADHSWFGVRDDWEAWRQHMTPNGFVLFHDVSPCCPGEFVYVLDRIFHGEIVDVRTQDTLTGGRYAGSPSEDVLTERGRELLTKTIRAPLELWPTELTNARCASERRFAARPANSKPSTTRSFAALGLEPDTAENAPIVGAASESKRHALALDIERHERESVPLRLFRDDDPRFFELFPVTLRETIRSTVSQFNENERELMVRSGLLGRCPILDFVEPGAVSRFLEEHDPAVLDPSARSTTPRNTPPVADPCFR